MQLQSLAVSRLDLAYIALGTVFVFFGFASCLAAGTRRGSEVSVLIWLGTWSGMYGTSLLLRQPTVLAALPHWLQLIAPFTINAISFLLVVVGLLVWSELTLGKMRLLTRGLAIAGLAIAFAGLANSLQQVPATVFSPKTISLPSSHWSHLQPLSRCPVYRASTCHSRIAFSPLPRWFSWPRRYSETCGAGCACPMSSCPCSTRLYSPSSSFRLLT